MAETNGAQLLVEGPQDVWLTSEPQMSFFRSSYKRHVPFGMSLERVNVNPGGLVRFDTSKGDLLGYVYMTKHDLVTDAHVPTPITFTSMATRLGEQILDKRDLMYLNTIRRVLETKNESQAKTPPGFQPLVLPFAGSYFPLVAIRHAQLDLVFEGLDGAYKYKVWGEFIHLPYEERSWFELSTHKLMIQQVRKTVPLNGDLCLSGPIKYIAWPTFNYTGEYISEYQPELISPGVTAISTASANTLTIAQTTNFYGVTTLAWSSSALPTGVTIASFTNNQITFAISQGIIFALQTFRVTVTTPYGKSASVSFKFAANPIVSFTSVVNYLDQQYLINNVSSPAIVVTRSSVAVFTVSAPGYPFVIQTAPSPYNAGAVYATGITNPGVDSGIIVWEVDPTTPSALYYVAQSTPAMTGSVIVIS
jgi:hypothetical protein